MAGKQVTGMKDVTNVMILGKTGNGKSLLGNCLLGRNVFNVASDEATTRETVDPQEESCDKGKYRLRVIDTPGYFESTTGNLDEKWEAILGAFQLVNNKVDVFLVVIAVTQLASGAAAISELRKCLGKQFLFRLIIVFTHKEDDELPLDECNEHLSNFNAKLLVHGLGLFGVPHKFSNQKPRDENVRKRIIKQLEFKIRSLASADFSAFPSRPLSEYSESYLERQLEATGEPIPSYDLWRRRSDMKLDLIEEYVPRSRIEEIIKRVYEKKRRWRFT